MYQESAFFPEHRTEIQLPLSSGKMVNLLPLIAFTMPHDWQWSFQEPATDTMEKIVDLHNDIMVFLILIMTFVLWMLIAIVARFNENNLSTLRFSFQHHTNIERIWTIIPTIILMFIAAPSFSLLYQIDNLHQPEFTLKIIGHQWYWSYEFDTLRRGDFWPEGDLTPGFLVFCSREIVSFDSYMIAEDDLFIGGLRLLEVDNSVVVPIKTTLRLLITSADVLHSWAIPAFGVKMDACPGRLNQVALHINEPGLYFGQCSELCGVNHGFMPIMVRAIKLDSNVL